MRASVGPYQILEKIGAGGMGEVFLGHDPRLERRVALKCLTSAETSSEQGRARVLREARAAARLNHPNIAGVYDVLELDDGTFIVMEYVEGISLAAHLASGPLPVEQVRAIGRQLASALAAAHASGVIHRDLKPANIQLTPDGSIKVLDFGVARLGAPTTATGTETPTGGLAAPTLGGNPGTLAYMSPEQLFSRPVDARSDIYSAGVVLFLMATGRRPYPETGAVALAMAMTAGPPPSAAALNPLVPADLSDAIAKALEREPAMRFQSARALESALSGAGTSTTTETAIRAMPDATARASTAVVSRRWWSVVAAAGVLVAIGIAARAPLLTRFGFGGAAPAFSRAVMESGIAVLPLSNLSAEPNQEYVADGMTEAIIAELGLVRSLRVISRRSVMRYKQSTTPVPQIARELGVGAVITGSVARIGDQLRVTVALVQPSPERQQWSATYDRGVGDMLTLSSEVAQAAVREVQATVTPQEEAQLTKPRPVNAAAQQAYLLGRYYWNKRTKVDIERAIAEFQRAIALDPNAALAYAGLADCYVIAWDNGYTPAQEAYREGKANASKALRLDDTIAEAHASLAAVYYFSALWVPAEQEFRRALALNPGYATAHQWLALMLSTRGRHAEAIAEARRALQLDPLSPLQNTVLGQRLYYAGDYAAAVPQFQRALALDPTFYFARDLLGLTYAAQQQYAAAVREFEEASRLEATANLSSGKAGWGSSNLGYGYALAGNTASATQVLNRLLAGAARGEVYPDFVANVYVGLRDYDRAIEWFTRAYQQNEGVVRDLAIDPRLSPISRDPRFLSLLQKSGLTYSPGRPRS